MAGMLNTAELAADPLGEGVDACMPTIENPAATAGSSSRARYCAHPPKLTEPGMKIGELARATRTNAQTIRYYEREGLLPQAARSAGNYRVYGDAHVERLSFIRHCRGLDMTLDEIRLLLGFRDAPFGDCGEVNALLDRHIDHVADRIRELRQLERQLRVLRERCGEVRDAAHCGILAGLTEVARGGAPVPARGHVHGVHKGGRPR